MKKLLMTLMCIAAMTAAGTGLRAQQVTIPIMPGWNWISCPMMDTLDFGTAMGSFTPVEGDVIKTQGGAAFYRNGHWIGTISQFYPGYGYMYKSSRAMPAFVTFHAQQPTSQVVVTTSEPMLVTAISAMGGGTVASNDGTYIIVKGICWATHPAPTPNDSHLEEGSGEGSFSVTMTDLNISTTYYVRAYAVTPNGTVYGEQKTFITRDGIPTLTTVDVTSITGATATCGGNITDNGGLTVTARGVCWSTSQNPTIADSHTTDGSGTGSFSSNIISLSVNTTYYVRAYATTAAGTAYGDEKTFTTRDGIPTLTTIDVTNITCITAACGGNIIDNGGLNVTARGVCWSTSPNPTIADSHTTNGSGAGSFNSSITGLIVSTTYYVRAYATTAAGTVYGDQKVFTTLDVTLTTADITNIGCYSATSGGNIINYDGLSILQYGVCWSTSPNPTVSDSHTIDYLNPAFDDKNCSFTSHISILNASTTYYVRAYLICFDDSNGWQSYTCYGNEVSFTTLDVPVGAINGVFSVSEYQQVFFSQGNLQYQASTNTWRFADNQYDYVGNDNSNISSTYSGWIDLFGWGTSGWNSGNSCYHPWDSDGSYWYGPPGQYNLTGSYANADWGVYNPISNGGNTANQWRTLTQPEWNYVFNTRTTTSGIRYAMAKVNNVNGVILLPDDWNSSIYSLSNTNSSGASFFSNTISSSQWTTLEDAGAVFLPAAGNRIETTVIFAGSGGAYWTASYYDSYYAYSVGFGDSVLPPENYGDRWFGFSVRLARAAE